MPLPKFYNPKKVGKLYVPDTPAATATGREAGVAPADTDKLKILLLLVDAQVDFVHTNGALSVPGAVEDTRRTIEWIYTHTDKITKIAASLDSHVPLQIFSPTWWVDKDGNHPAPFTPITQADVVEERWIPLYEKGWSEEYVRELNQQARKDLMIWPFHTLIGTPGHNLVPSLYEAIAYHSTARQTQPQFLQKGAIPKTEHYSILEPEVKVSDEPLGILNEEFLEMLAFHDLIYVAGQAKSHCVLETVNSMMNYFERETVRKIRILYDCTSSVAHPEIDFDTIASEKFTEFEKKGLKLVKSSDPIA